ncbi:MAG TPA: hypothetical protein VNO21_10425 [Polyangiaceae bacterium]|nr:hypothetical protein [Polyangiaceae bacterium]
MTFLDDAARAHLGALADLLIPEDGDMPSASGAGVAGPGVDAVLAARPDLVEPLRIALALAAEMDPPRALATLRTEHPAAFTALGEIAAGGYFLQADIQRRIGYRGRAALPIDTAPVDAELLGPVLARGAIWRADPRGAQ